MANQQMTEKVEALTKDFLRDCSTFSGSLTIMGNVLDQLGLEANGFIRAGLSYDFTNAKELVAVLKRMVDQAETSVNALATYEQKVDALDREAGHD